VLGLSADQLLIEKAHRAIVFDHSPMHTLDAFLPEGQIEQRPAGPRRYSTERGTGAEALEVRRRLGGFNPACSTVGRLLEEAFPEATKSELISVAQMTIIVANQRFQNLPQSFNQLDRIIRRSKDLVIKWYHDHWMFIQLVFRDIGLADGSFMAISRNGRLG
jgi:hypothetical protein